MKARLFVFIAVGIIPRGRLGIYCIDATVRSPCALATWNWTRAGSYSDEPGDRRAQSPTSGVMVTVPALVSPGASTRIPVSGSPISARLNASMQLVAGLGAVEVAAWRRVDETAKHRVGAES